jgi:hypothetical protein
VSKSWAKYLSVVGQLQHVAEQWRKTSATIAAADQLFAEMIITVV